MPVQLTPESSPVANELKAAISMADISLDELSETTKVPRTTIRYLLGERVSAILPERVYLRGHLGVLAISLGADRTALESAFDATFPLVQEQQAMPVAQTRFRSQSMAVGAALGGVALLSVVAALVSALG
ncbi:MAG: helix-turn-helix domain-containing protein [Myxococcales bacterium]|nr:helix-turn-helix domain-containing protein [Myxococcales bacterium]